MNENIGLLSLVSLLKKKNILTSEEVKDLTSIALLQKMLESKGIICKVDVDTMAGFYDGIVNKVREYFAVGRDKKEDVMLSIEELLSNV